MTSERKKSADAEPTASAVETAAEPSPSKTVVWDDKDMQSTYANVINVISTREEFSLFFGTNQTWNPIDAPALVVKLANRILLTPHIGAVTQTETGLAALVANIARFERGAALDGVVDRRRGY